MERGERLTAPQTPRTPLLYVERNGLEFIGIEEAFESPYLEDQRVAINGLLAVCRIYERGEQLDNNPCGMNPSKHHWWGGEANQEALEELEGVEHRIARGFMRHVSNWDRIRRDVHTHIENKYGWPVLPRMFDMATHLNEADRHVSTKTRKAAKTWLNNNQ